MEAGTKATEPDSEACTEATEPDMVAGTEASRVSWLQSQRLILKSGMPVTPSRKRSRLNRRKISGSILKLSDNRRYFLKSFQGFIVLACVLMICVWIGYLKGLTHEMKLTFDMYG